MSARRARALQPGRERPRRPGAATSGRSGHQAHSLWWLNPVVITLAIVLPIYLATLAFDMRSFEPVVYVPGWEYAFGVLLIVSMGTGMLLALPHGRAADQAPAPPPPIPMSAMMALLLPTLMAYLIWFGPLLTSPQLLLEIVRGERAELRSSLSTVQGVTTFTQFGVAYAIAYALKRSGGVQTISRVETIGLVLVFALALVRTFVWAERLALLELMVCYVVSRLAFLRIRTPRRWRQASVVPAVAPFVVYGLFTANEYFRSWPFYVNQYDSVWHFTLERLMAYYATAVNNGIGALVDTTGWPHYSGAFISEGLYLMPGLGRLVTAAFGDPRHVPEVWLEVFGRPEFNSRTQFFRIVLDLGYFWSLVYFIGYGYMVGRAYHGFRNGHLFGLLMYGVLVLGLLESIRYGYLGETRFVPLALGLLVLAWFIRRERLRQFSGERPGTTAPPR